MNRPSPEGTGGSFLRHGGIVFASTMLANAANYMLHLLLVRQLGVVGYGTVSAILSIVTIVAVAGVIAGTGFASVVARSRALHGNRAIRRIADTAVLWSLSAAGVAALLTFAGQNPLAAYLHIGDKATIEWSCVLLGVGIALPAIRGIYQGAERYTAWGLSMALEAGGRLLAIPLVAAGLSTGGAVAGLFAGSALALVVSVVNVVTFGARTTERDDDVKIKIGTGTALAVALITIFQVYDLILAKHYLAPLESGDYIAASIAGRILFMLVSTIPVVLLPKTALASTRGDATLHLLFKALAATTVLAALCLGIIAIAPATVAVALAGRAAEGAGAYLLQYGAATTCVALTSVIVTYRIGISDLAFVPFLASVLVAEAVFLGIFHQSAHVMLTVVVIGHGTSTLAALAYIGRKKAREPDYEILASPR